MTRSHKQNNGDRTSHGIETYLPLTREDDADEGRSTAPYKAKKDGGGKGNWYPSHLPKHTPNIPSSCFHAPVCGGARFAMESCCRIQINSRGRDGDEIEDVIDEEQITTSKPRRRSNSNGGANAANGVAGAVKSKFEVNDIDEEAVEEQQ